MPDAFIEPTLFPVAPTRLSAGVAMCTYNGGRFLRAQLESIALQSELPQRMAIVDDGSVDGSWELLQRWAATAPFEVQLHRNSENLGVVRNFERAIGLLEQDVVFLADQDDIWYPDKLKKFVDCFIADPELGLLHSDADLIDGDGRLLRRRLFDTLLVTAQERQEVGDGKAYRVYSKRNLVTGAASAFRRTILLHALPFSGIWVHDEWLAFIAALTSKVVLMDESLMSYRLHGSNAIGVPIPNLAWRIRTIVSAFWQPVSHRQCLRAARLREMESRAVGIGATPEMQCYLAAAADHADFRSQLPRNPVTRFLRVLEERRAGNYHAWSNGETSILHDLLLGN